MSFETFNFHMKGESTSTSSSYSDNNGANEQDHDFECNICFELAQDPIVTLCGHLFCWPCLYRWLHHHSHSQECPVCKALVQDDKLVPLYGRGKNQTDPRKKRYPGMRIPNRPAGQRPETASPPQPPPQADAASNLFNYGVGLMGGFMPMATTRIGNFSFGVGGLLPSLFNFQFHGFPDAALYGTTYGGYHTGFRGVPAHGQDRDQNQSDAYLKKLALLVGFGVCTGGVICAQNMNIADEYNPFQVLNGDHTVSSIGTTVFGQLSVSLKTIYCSNNEDRILSCVIHHSLESYLAASKGLSSSNLDGQISMISCRIAMISDKNSFRLHLLFFFFFFSSLSSFATAQQPYVGKSTTNCSVADNSTSVLGYSCNGLNKTCSTYVIFRSTPPFSTVSSISSLFSVDSSLLSSLNNASTTTSFPSDQRVIIPVTCSCSGNNNSYSQSNLTYTIRPKDSYFFIANDTLEGLSTCQALQRQNNVSSESLVPGMRIVVPVRCACPTAKQVREDGVNYLVSYAVVFGDTVEIISERFGVETSKTLEANQMSFEKPGVFPFTTVLVPLQNPPSNLNSLTPPPPPPSPTPVSPPLSPDGGKPKRTWVYVLAGVLGGALVLSLIGLAIFCLAKKKPINKEENGNLDSFTAKKSISEQESEFDPLDGLSGMVVDTLKVYKFHELQSATSDFTSSSSIGGSGYIGKINGDGAMIKKIEGNASEEINLLSKLNHFNIIRLSGFCFHEGDWYLVYEHASNGSLSDWIYAKSLLSSTQRLQIALDIATGLNYLHNFADPPYVHRDLTSGNIFLDFEFRAKIGNLGLARSTERGGDYVLTKHVEGTRGKEASELKKEIHEGNAMEEILSSGSFLPEGLVSFVVRLVVDCLKRDHLSRPSMDEIVLSLSKILTASKSWESSY
ncbi:unnamed protein product [Thlaspi arvense]|uniref:Uncharacterized protein n=1 Tax=Thlaspi arvense TaxID=13288 RepID=A0AAU9SAF7_THLAR|nr:unnamed protein product [Thlaspi arvense]